MAHSHKKLIWKVFMILSIITLIEVILGILKPPILVHSNFLWGVFPNFLKSSTLNWIFIILTLVKAYYIMWYFMHLSDEKSNFRTAIILPLLILIPYLVALVLIEANYVQEVLQKYIHWNFS